MFKYTDFKILETVRCIGREQVGGMAQKYCYRGSLLCVNNAANSLLKQITGDFITNQNNISWIPSFVTNHRCPWL